MNKFKEKELKLFWSLDEDLGPDEDIDYLTGTILPYAVVVVAVIVAALLSA